MALEALIRCVPVLTLVGHLTLVNADVLSARVAVLGVHVLEARAAVRTSVAHDVALAAHLTVALVAAEMLHVPTAPLRLRALVSEDNLQRKNKFLKSQIFMITRNNKQWKMFHEKNTFRPLEGGGVVFAKSVSSSSTKSHLITSAAARLQSLGVVSAAIDVSILVEVDEVDEQLSARVTHEAGGMPTDTVSRARRKHRHLPDTHLLPALQWTKSPKINFTSRSEQRLLFGCLILQGYFVSYS